MSLLNDALRAAEQRQNRPGEAGPYTGQVPAGGRINFRLWAIVILSLGGVVAGFGYWFQAQSGGEAAPAVVSAAPVAEPAPPVEPEAQPEPQPEPESEADIAKAPEPATPTPSKQASPGRPVADTGQPGTGVEESTAESVAESQMESAVESAATPSSSAPASKVKQIRETPEAIDLRVSRELTSLLRSGKTRDAEQRLRELAASQPATASREVFARGMLVQGMPDRALAWLPAAVADAHAGLRLLRARALHARGDLSGAIATLERQVPTDGQNTEYRVTLATLLQQAGRSTEAARHWSVLIARDDSRATWWVGLAIALETGGEVRGAVRAYGQAAQLPGLSPSLADYVRERLKTLQAG
ncbi:tetratricopeptide repeat protein [Marinobacter sp. SS8-8]|uniref:tetratricopeptide repeat protein n=1 Tax=Marinobacter sp. SS8-8 TaxID=3050452 RepID=UPI0026E0CA15|nr:tetratricopeptide repeat protein [Marinobacter sp. SS8-8]|tara:strand:- start:78226 stop:79299 length:1074 start_codon:yes stop_codon:yes gene_type:complete